MNDKLENLVSKLPKDNIICLMMNSLDLMQQYNGRSRAYCIADAIGCTIEEDKNGKLYISKYPTLAEAKDYTKSYI